MRASELRSSSFHEATAEHCAFYLISSATVHPHQEARKHDDTSKGTICFQADVSQPADLMRRLIAARAAENAG
jgi:uncharacterized protein YdhG (YjbR/CyaY superfamily)